MTIQSRYKHTIAVHRRAVTRDGGGQIIYDDYRQPVVADTTVVTVPGLVQPRRATERPSPDQAGTVVGDYLAFLDPLAGLTTADWFIVNGERYDIVGIANAAGVGHHLEVELKRAAVDASI